MNLLEAIGLGVLQGATEFLPVSSSGHLRIMAALFDADAEPDLIFDIVLHLGTLVAVLVVYRRDLLTIARGLLAGLRALVVERSLAAALRPEGARLALLVGCATIPTGLIGVLAKDLIESPIFSIPVVGGLLLINAAILFASRFSPSLRHAMEAGEGGPASEPPPAEAEPVGLRIWNITWVRALIIGVAQGIAVLPGISRSGLTITTALWLNVPRQEAARYSFLLSIPAILGALVLKLPDALDQPWDGARLATFGVGALASALVGWGCLVLLMRMLRSATFHHFAWYCLAVGLVAIGWAVFA